MPVWLAAVLAVGGAVGLWKFAGGLLQSGARTELIKELGEAFLSVTDGNGIGDRLKQVEVKVSSHDGRIDALERTDQTHNFQVALLTERQGKLEGRQEHTERLLEETLRKVHDRLGNIEGKLETIIDRGGK